MEVKAGQMLPKWLLEYFAEHGMRRGSISKYGTEYKRYLRRQIEEGTLTISDQIDGVTPRLPILPQYLTT